MWEAKDSKAAMVAPSRGRGLKPKRDGGTFRTRAVAPSRGRGLKPTKRNKARKGKKVAPSRGRGLKQEKHAQYDTLCASPLHGGVD